MRFNTDNCTTTLTQADYRADHLDYEGLFRTNKMDYAKRKNVCLLFEKGKSFGEIEDATGAKPRYIQETLSTAGYSE